MCQFRLSAAREADRGACGACCSACDTVKPAGDFYRYTYSKDGLYQQCKACHARAGEVRLGRQGDPATKVRAAGRNVPPLPSLQSRPAPAALPPFYISLK